MLDTYGTEQRRLAFGVIRDMRRSPMEMLLPPLGHHLRSLLLRATLPSAAFQRRTEWMMSDFGRHHRPSPLSWQRGRGRTGPRAGDRVPDMLVTPVGGGPVRLHRLLSYDCWTLLLTSRDDAAVRAVREICASGSARIEVVALSSAGDGGSIPSPDLRLVRPDGYVGLVAPVDRPDILRDYLRTFLTVRT